MIHWAIGQHDLTIDREQRRVRLSKEIGARTLEGPAADIVAQLSAFANEWRDLELSYDWDGGFVLTGWRDLTDADIAAEEKRAADNLQRIEERERAEFDRLSRKFGPTP